jgi:uncharacterized RDD family membrane protein YckC
MTQYWVIRGGERRGPYEESDVLEGVELGTVRPNDLLWVDGMREGVPIAEVIANLGTAPASRPPLTLEPLAPAASAGRSPYRPPSARVDDLAELALGNIQYAGFWVRYAAATLDNLTLGFVLVALLLLVGAFTGMRALLEADLWVNGALIVADWLYFAVLESGPRCAGYGKRAFNLQVRTADDLTRSGFLRASARWLGRYVSAVLLLLGYLIQPFTPRKRALHDFLSGTVVVVQAPYSRLLVWIVAMFPLIVLAGLFMLGAGVKLLELLGR